MVFFLYVGVADRVLGSVNLLWEMTSAFGIKCNFFSGSMIASTLTDLAKVGRMTLFQNPMMLRSDEGSKLDDVSLFVHPKKKDERNYVVGCRLCSILEPRLMIFISLGHRERRGGDERRLQITMPRRPDPRIPK